MRAFIGKKSFVLMVGLALLVLLFSIMMGIVLGAADLSADKVLAVIKLKLFGIEQEALKRSEISIIWELRLPRVLLAIAAGGSLAVAGAAMQAVTQNVLADPYILGASGGASSAVAFCYFLGSAFYASSAVVSAFAFAGAMVALILVYTIGRVGNPGATSRLVLSGIAVGVILNAMTQFFVSISPDASTVRSIIAWTMGSLASARWGNIAFPFFGSLLGSCFFMFTARAYNLMSQGDETAISLGINVAVIKRLTILVVAFITGVIVAAGGIIGFVGFVIPHIIRMLAGADHRRVFPLSFLLGSVFLLWMDVLARTLMAPRELSVGIFTAFFGGPFFVYLLYRQNKYGRI